MDEPDIETLPVQQEHNTDLVQTSLELHIRSSDGKKRVLPINRNTFEVEFEEGQALNFTHRAGLVSFKARSKSSRIYKDGERVKSGRMDVGSFLEVGAQRVLLWDTGKPTAYVKGYSSGEIWPLEDGENTIGRAGSRDNVIQLDHPTVSRAHATIIAGSDGNYRILAESTTNPVYLRGDEVEPNTTLELENGDLLEIGELLFRFHQPRADSPELEQDATIRVQSLGGMTVSVAGRQIADQDWKTQNVKWLFAHLAFQWGRPLSTDLLMEELWPDLDPQKTRNNFNFSISTLRQLLRSRLPESQQGSEVILRSRSALQLNPDLLDRHDAIELQRLASGPMPDGADSSWDTAARGAILGYTGPFLHECYLDWAVTARQNLELQFMELSKTLLSRLEESEDLGSVAAVAGHVLQVDRFAQWACLKVMNALRRSNRASEALRFFERNRAVWMDELGEEPESELLAEHQRILAML